MTRRETRLRPTHSTTFVARLRGASAAATETAATAGVAAGGTPMGRPIDGRALVDALKQMADFVSKAILVSMEKQTDFNSKTTQMLTNAIGDARKDGIELNQQLHANIMPGARTDHAPGLHQRRQLRGVRSADPHTRGRTCGAQEPEFSGEAAMTKIYLGTFDIKPGEVLAIPTADVEAAAAVIQEASFQQAEEARRVAEGIALPPPKPRVVRDIIWTDGWADDA